jgi:hypothetical protein
MSVVLIGVIDAQLIDLDFLLFPLLVFRLADHRLRHRWVPPILLHCRWISYANKYYNLAFVYARIVC